MAKRILYLDPFSGISGDMLVGALLDLGLDLNLLRTELAKLKLEGYRVEVSSVLRGVMAGKKFDVFVGDKKESNVQDAPKAHDHSHSHDHSHDHSHAHEKPKAHDHSHSHEKPKAQDHGHAHEHSHAHEHGKDCGHDHGAHSDSSFKTIKARIENSALSLRVKTLSIKAFSLLAEVEGRMHGMKPDEVSFHEVGAVDSIVDMVGACIGIDALKIDEVWCGPLALGGEGSGYLHVAHGKLPIPAPATLELVNGLPLRTSGVEKELTTPTGAALVKALAVRYGSMPAMKIEKTGYGAGSRNDPKIPIPNLLRAVIGELDEQGTAANTGNDSICELQANLDDIAPEILGYVGEQLLKLGALDYFTVPIGMKKSRPGILLTVLCPLELRDAVAELLFRETTTFGIRYETKQRLKLDRKMREVRVPWGLVRVKEGFWNGERVSVHPEYDDCRRIADAQGVPLKTVIEAARQACT